MSRQHVPRLIHHRTTLLHMFRGGFTASLGGRGKCQAKVIKKTWGAVAPNYLIYNAELNDSWQETNGETHVCEIRGRETTAGGGRDERVGYSALIVDNETGGPSAVFKVKHLKSFI